MVSCATAMLKLCNLLLFLVFNLQQVALENGLILVDTKYEFGKTADGTIVLIDEVVFLILLIFLNVVLIISSNE